MKKMLILMAVAVVTANSVGCCCRRLCPWLTQGAYCGPTAMAATPTQFAAPAPTYGMGSSWDPCQCAVVPYGSPVASAPVGAPCPPMAPGAMGAPYAAPGGAMPYAPMAGAMPYAPMAGVMPMMASGEPGCAYEPGCGEPYMGGVGYGGFGPMMMPSDCANCGIGYGGGFGGPMPESYVDPGPVAE